MMELWMRAVIWALCLAVTIPFLADRYRLPVLLYTNHPSRLQSVSAFADYKIKFQDIIRNCEDVLIDEELGVAFLSCDPGRDRWNTVMGIFRDPDYQTGTIYYYEYAKYGLGDEGSIHRLPIDGWGSNEKHSMTFHPLGLGYYPKTKTLYVVNHSKAGPAIEVLQINSQGNKATYKRTIENKMIHTPNAVLPISENEILCTDDHKWSVAENPIMAKLETFTAYPGGSLTYVNLETNTARKFASIPFANGLAQLNKTHIAVTSTVLPAVLIYKLDPEREFVTLEQKLRPPFWADNLRVDSTGKLLIAGHPHALVLQDVAKNNQHYDLDGTGNEGLRPVKDRPRAPSWVVEWDGNVEGKLRTLYVGKEYGTSTTAVRDAKRKIGLVAGLYEKGIMVWKE